MRRDSPSVVVVVVILVMLAAATVTTVHADTPTAVNFAACNAEAEAAVKSGTAAPNTQDHVRAAAARKAKAAPADTGSTQGVAGLRDPQVVGMALEGAGDAAYQAAYRTCMRRSGF